MDDEGNVYEAKWFTDRIDGALVFEDHWVEKMDMGVAGESGGT